MHLAMPRTFQLREGHSASGFSPHSPILLIVPGRKHGVCGVADFAERLADELDALGHRAIIASLDGPLGGSAVRWASHASGVEQEPATRYEIVEKNFTICCEQLGELIKAVKPAVVSLQFFPYGFSRNGWLLPRLRPLAAALRKSPLHFHFHEIWTDTSFRSGLIVRVKELIRCAEVRALVSLSRPRWVHTTCERYRRSLGRIGIRATVLHVPSNVRQHSLPNSFRIETLMPGAAWPSSCQIAEHFHTAIVFGRVYPGWDCEGLIEKLRAHSARSSRRLFILSIGASGFSNSGWERVRAISARLGVETAQLGIQPEDTISHVLQHADCGLSPTPFDLSTKSGTNAAMSLHGLNVFFGQNVPPPGSEIPENYFFLDQAWPKLKRVAGAPEQAKNATAFAIVRDLDVLQKK
jgi:hypothetical protein